MLVSTTLLAVLAFNLFFYGAYLSFPLMTEDGASNYSSLVDVAGFGPLLTRIPISFLEGLGQANLLVTATYDPFSWLMFLDGDKADLFRLSIALRATACWLTSYLFIKSLLRGRTTVAIVGAFVSLALNFTLTNPYGMPTYGGVFNGTHAAMFPLLLWLHLLVSRQQAWLGWRDALLFVSLAIFFLVYPLGSLIGVAVLFAFATVLLVFSKSSARVSVWRALLKLSIAVAILLLAPGWGFYETWSAIANISARKVFADELFSYGTSLDLPFLWNRRGPWLIRLVILGGLAVLLFNRRWPRYLRVAVGTLALVIGVSQPLGLARALGIGSSLLERLPRAFYLEFYLPIFYAIATAFVIVYWSKVIRPSPRYLWRWLLGLAFFSIFAYAMMGPFGLLAGIFIAIVGTIVTVRTTGQWTAISAWVVFSLLAFVTLRFVAMPLIVLWTFLLTRKSGMWGAHELTIPMAVLSPRWISAGRLCLTGSIVIGAPLLWILAPNQVSALFGETLHCRKLSLWCEDPAGVTMNAASHPLVEFLQVRLSPKGRFLGRADFLLVPAPRLEQLPLTIGETSEEEFNKLLEWYRRSYETNQFKFKRAYGYTSPPESFQYDFPTGPVVAKLRWHMEYLASAGEPFNGVLSDDVLTEIAEWKRPNLDDAKLQPIKFRSAWATEQEVALMIQERTRNFFSLGNGLLLRSLPLQRVPVATSYEQGLDYLYYLFWTRYVNLGATALHSINFTILETLNPKQLALIGVRYVVVRDVPLMPKPSLERVFSAAGYSIYEIPNANTAGFSPTRILSSDSETLLEELKLMRSPGFDPQREAVVSMGTRRALGSEVRLAPMNDSQIVIEHQSIQFTARSQGGRSLAILPFKYSHCWKPTWRSSEGTIIRANLALIGVVFDNSVDVTLTWDAGYGPASGCLKKDAALISDAVTAARTIR